MNPTSTTKFGPLNATALVVGNQHLLFTPDYVYAPVNNLPAASVDDIYALYADDFSAFLSGKTLLIAKPHLSLMADHLTAIPVGGVQVTFSLEQFDADVAAALTAQLIVADPLDWNMVTSTALPNVIVERRFDFDLAPTPKPYPQQSPTALPNDAPAVRTVTRTEPVAAAPVEPVAEPVAVEAEQPADADQWTGPELAEDAALAFGTLNVPVAADEPTAEQEPSFRQPDADLAAPVPAAVDVPVTEQPTESQLRAATLDPVPETHSPQTSKTTAESVLLAKMTELADHGVGYNVEQAGEATVLSLEGYNPNNAKELGAWRDLTGMADEYFRANDLVANRIVPESGGADSKTMFAYQVAGQTYVVNFDKVPDLFRSVYELVAPFFVAVMIDLQS